MPTVTWQDNGTPVSIRFDDPYFSADDGLAETRHVFLQGNNLPTRFRPGFRIAELGFGTGLNAMAAWRAWCDSGQSTQLHYTSFEAWPLCADIIAQALDLWPELSDHTTPFLEGWRKNPGRFETPTLRLEVIIGDAASELPKWRGTADAWFLDGFSPAKNPDIWSPALMRAVASHTALGGSFATYTAAGHVRRALAKAGFSVTRLPGYGRKRHMSIGRMVTQ